MRRSRKFWEKVVSEVAVGETQASAAARFGVTRAAVQYWVSKVRRERDAGGPQLLPVHVAAVAPATIELEAGGVFVRLPGEVGTAYVAELVRALRTC